ncbi:DNA repair protein RecO [Patescibacteria group bacterium]|nr:DNA repair protein RecO [Patescibacteria group bacterium]MBU0963701.1 DNA repair protein RecO [Patescibacteria group bacterium]
MGTYHTQGIIIKHKNFREADRIITIFTKEFGKIAGLARGARKITSKLAGRCEPFLLSNFIMARGRNYDTITSSEVIEYFHHLKSNNKRLALVQYIGELIDRSAKPSQRDIKIYNLVKEIFEYLENNNSNSNYPLVIWYFIWRYLSYLGYQPELYECAICHKKVAARRNYFSLKRGGIICYSCQSETSEIMGISNNLIKFLRLILDKELVYLRKIKYNQQLLKELNLMTKEYLQYTLEEDLLLDNFLKAS